MVNNAIESKNDISLGGRPRTWEQSDIGELGAVVLASDHIGFVMLRHQGTLVLGKIPTVPECRFI